jgi:hypothetical protein
VVNELFKLINVVKELFKLIDLDLEPFKQINLETFKTTWMRRKLLKTEFNKLYENFIFHNHRLTTSYTRS